jgi:hypothetical protein
VAGGAGEDDGAGDEEEGEKAAGYPGTGGHRGRVEAGKRHGLVANGYAHHPVDEGQSERLQQQYHRRRSGHTSSHCASLRHCKLITSGIPHRKRY